MFTSDNMEMQTASQSDVYIQLPKKYMDSLLQHYDLDHGLFMTGLNPKLKERYIQAYFKQWGTITACEVKLSPHSEAKQAVAYVRFSEEAEADNADWAGPHVIGGTEVEVKRVVTPRMKG